MDLSLMISSIITTIDNKYGDDNESLDIKQIKTFCKLHKPDNTDNNSKKKYSSLSYIDISTPDEDKLPKKPRKKQLKINSPEFMKIYSLFIKIVYSCLKLDVNIFNTELSDSKKKSDCDNLVTIKNNYQLIKSIELCKKKCIKEHIIVLEQKQKRISSTDTNEYEKYVKEYLIKIKILNRLIGWINIFENNNNLFSLLLPYFYKYTQYIEEYVG